MSELSDRYDAVSAEYAAVVSERATATARVVAQGPELMRRMRQELDQHAMRLRGRRTVTRSVLIVDDHQGIREMLSTRIETTLHVPVFTAASVAEARMRWAMERCAVVVCDLYLGQGFGDDLLMELPREVRTIVISGVADVGHLKLVAAVTGSLPLQKPAETVVEDVRRALLLAVPA